MKNWKERRSKGKTGLIVERKRLVMKSLISELMLNLNKSY